MWRLVTRYSKKKEATALHLKTDSLVVESYVHFPTDYNLLRDSARKSIDMVTKLQENNDIPGWRKIKEWRNSLKTICGLWVRASRFGGSRWCFFNGLYLSITHLVVKQP